MFPPKKLIWDAFAGTLTFFYKKGRSLVALIFPAFDAIRIVSLTSRVDRRAQIQREFARFDIAIGQGNVQFFDAIQPPDDGGFPSVGARGCFLSHLEILRQARDSGWSRFLVLEDDALFTPPFGHAGALVDFCRTDEWDFLYPGHILPPVPGPLRWIPTVDGVQCTHAYALCAAVLPRLIAFLEGILSRPPGDPGFGPMHIDAAYSVFMDREPGIRTFRASRSLVIQRSSKSDVAPRRHVDRWLPPGMIRFVRAVKSWIRLRV